MGKASRPPDSGAGAPVPSPPPLADTPPSLVPRTRWTWPLIVAALLALGLLLRLQDLTDPPLGFHPDRQLRAGVIARGVYYRIDPDATDPETRQQGIALAQAEERYEPRIFEWLVALTYRVVGEEHLWIARVYAAIFWTLGGLPLFALARRFTRPEGAAVALGYYLFLPFAVVASRAFQPDPLMVATTVAAAYCLYRWSEDPTWRWTVPGGLAGGLAVLLKAPAAFPVGGMALALTLGGLGPRRAVRDRRVWALAALLIGIPASYYLVGLGGRAGGYLRFWSLSLADLLTQPWFYVRWLDEIHHLLDLYMVLVGLVGVLLAPAGRARSLLLGLWAGYALYGLSLPYLIYTHDYYNLPLVPIVALSLAPVAGLVLGGVARQGRVWRALFLGIAALAVFYPAWNARLTLYAKDYRGEPAGWRNLSEALPKDGPIIALTHDYGTRINYYGMRSIGLWPHAGDLRLAELRGDDSGQDFDRLFETRTEGFRYFLVTLPGALEGQPALKSRLYERYPLIAERPGLLLFDLGERANESP